MQKIKDIIKHSAFFGRFYLLLVGMIIAILKIFVQTDDKTVLFISFSGRKFNDSPKAIYDAMRADAAFADYNLVWAFNDPDQFPDVDAAHKISANGLGYFKQLLHAKYWVANSSIERLVPFKHPHNIYIQTWHGVPLKKLGPDEANLEFLVKHWFAKAQFDVLLASSEYDADIFSRIFPSSAKPTITGLPRSANLLRDRSAEIANLQDKLQLDIQKKTVLYAPTFREYDSEFASALSQAAQEGLASEYNLLVRGHYFMNDNVVIGIDVTEFADLNLLMQASDILITDYSSIMFDYAVLNRPIVLLQPDAEEYAAKRGMYLDPAELGLPIVTDEMSLFEALGKVNHQELAAFAHRFEQHDATYGISTVLNEIRK
ncbi:CDP-glycerol glycerophosphotransferase family protein [Periweissella cryptocerci]|nr:CDP-glycerol glycerophosphotransferase family protein [Periweissella cryptocerci]